MDRRKDVVLMVWTVDEIEIRSTLEEIRQIVLVYGGEDREIKIRPAPEEIRQTIWLCV
jgi:hypothetical protein